MNLQYKFYLPIGDWSGDGHERCEYFLVESSKPVDEVREAHFRIKEATGIDIEDLCSRTEEDALSEEVYEQLNEMGFSFSNLYGDPRMMSVDDIKLLWLFLLEKADPQLILRVPVEEPAPLLTFHGYDEKGRHIKSVGYGLFMA